MIIISKNISIIVLAIAHAGISIAQQVISCPNGVRARAEWQDLSAGMKKRYFDATIKLHSDGKYDNFSHLHSERYFDWHENSQFLPAHRQYLLEYEKALRAIDPGLTLPYFDWSLDATDIKKSAIWDDLGRNEPGKCFTQGPFVNWTSTINGQHCVTRNIKLDGGSPFLMTATEVFKTAIRNIGNFSTYQKWISEVHNHFHKGIGGDMRLISFSAGDPIFYLHHAYVDKLWADWQRYDPQKRLKQYNGKNYGNITVSLSDIIQPYGVTVESVMNTRQLCYMYLPPGSRFDGPRNKPPRSQSHSHTKTPAAASRTTKKAASTSSSRSTTTTPPPSNATKQQQPVVVKKRDSSGIVMPQIPPQLPQEFYIVNNMTSMNGSAMHEMTRHFYQLTYEELKSGKYLGGPGTGPDPSPPSIPYGRSAFGGPAPYSRITVQSVSDYVVPADQIQQVAKQVYPHRSYNFGTEDSAAGSLNHGGGYFILSMELCLGILIYIVQT